MQFRNICGAWVVNDYSNTCNKLSTMFLTNERNRLYGKMNFPCYLFPYKMKKNILLIGWRNLFFYETGCQLSKNEKGCPIIGQPNILIYKILIDLSMANNLF